MSGTVDVVLDLADDIGPIKTLRERTARTGARVIAIPPGRTNSRVLIWAILRALGKTSDSVRDLLEVNWFDAQRWLRAYGIHTVIVVAAQHLSAVGRAELCDHLGGAGIDTVLVYGGHTDQSPTKTLGELLEALMAPPARAQASAWPEVPRSHPLRFRHDCEQQLSLEDFAAVETLLGDVHARTERRLLRGLHTDTAGRLSAEAVAVLRQGDNPNQRYIRECAVAIAFATTGYPQPTSGEVPRIRAAKRVLDRAARHIRPEFAAFHVAQAVTGLPTQDLELVRGDQLNRGRILGHPAPTAARSLLAAMPDGAWVAAPPDVQHQPSTSDTFASPIRKTAFAGSLSRILRERSHREPIADLDRPTIEALERLVEVGAVERANGCFRMTAIAAFSTFNLGAERPLARVADPLLSGGNT